MNNIFNKINTGKEWYVFYTHPKSEKVAHRELLKYRYEPFLPLVRTLKVWKNRQRKMIEEVLFPGYIFVKTDINEIFDILKISKIASYVRYDGKPALIRQSEIDKIRKLIDLDSNISIISDFTVSERVRIMSGPLVGYEGILIQQRGKNRVGLQINDINQIVSIEVNINILEKIK